MKEEKIHWEDKCIMCGKIINRNPYIKPPQPCPECQGKPEQKPDSDFVKEARKTISMCNTGITTTKQDTLVELGFQLCDHLEAAEKEKKKPEQEPDNDFVESIRHRVWNGNTKRSELSSDQIRLLELCDRLEAAEKEKCTEKCIYRDDLKDAQQEIQQQAERIKQLKKEIVGWLNWIYYVPKEQQPKPMIESSKQALGKDNES